MHVAVHVDHDAGGDVRLGEPFARGAGLPEHAVERLDGGRELNAPSLDPRLVAQLGRPQVHFVPQLPTLVDDCGGERDDLPGPVTQRRRRRHERPLRPDPAVQVVEDRRAFDDYLSLLGHQSGNLDYRIELPDVVVVVPRGPGTLVELDPVHVHRDGDPAGIGRTVPPYQERFVASHLKSPSIDRGGAPPNRTLSLPPRECSPAALFMSSPERSTPRSARLYPPGCLSIISEITTWSRLGFLNFRMRFHSPGMSKSSSAR